MLLIKRDSLNESLLIKHHREPFQNADRALVGKPNLGRDRNCPEQDDVEDVGASGQKLGRLGHGPDVGRDVDRVGHDQKANEASRYPARTYLGHVGGEPSPGHEANARRKHLDADHQRRGEQQRPHQAETELGPRLRVSRDTARVVVGRSRDEAGAQATREVVGIFLSHRRPP